MEEKVRDILEDFFTTPGFEDCYIVEVKHSGNKLEVFVDSDGALTFEKCQRMSRKLEKEYLDIDLPMGESYTLDVSSPGVGKPLKMWRQYPKNIGRTLEVSLQEGDSYTGKLITVEPERIVLEAKVRRKEGKRKVTSVEEIEIPFDTIKKTIVKISF